MCHVRADWDHQNMVEKMRHCLTPSLALSHLTSSIPPSPNMTNDICGRAQSSESELVLQSFSRRKASRKRQPRLFVPPSGLPAFPHSFLVSPSRETLSELQTHLRELTEDHARKSQALSLDQGEIRRKKCNGPMPHFYYIVHTSSIFCHTTWA